MLMSRRRGISLTGLALLAVAGGCSTDSSVAGLRRWPLRRSTSPKDAECFSATSRLERASAWDGSPTACRRDASDVVAGAARGDGSIAPSSSRTSAEPDAGLHSSLRSDSAVRIERRVRVCAARDIELFAAPCRRDASCRQRRDQWRTHVRCVDQPHPRPAASRASGGLYHRVLEPLHTQVSTMVEQNPKLVSVELGGGGRSWRDQWVPIRGGSMVPYAVWQTGVRPCARRGSDQPRRWPCSSGSWRRAQLSGVSDRQRALARSPRVRSRRISP